jgi:holo-[acyl-carrier protein] synthase
MILGIGVDLVEVRRIREAIERSGERFLRRIFTEEEIAYCSDKARKYEHFAARYAAKEAALKALGAGIDRESALRSVGVSHAEDGRPLLRFSGAVQQTAGRLNVTKVHVSISHSDDYAVAQVVLECGVQSAESRMQNGERPRTEDQGPR